MFQQLFTAPVAIFRHQSSPFAAERQLYLKHLVDEGRSRKTVRNIAQLLVVVAEHLRLDRSEITLVEIEAAAAAWAGSARRSARCLHVGKRQFVYHATGLLRLFGRLRESRREVPCAAQIDVFLDFQRHERCLAPSTLHHYELCVGAFLAWLDLKGKPLGEVTLEDISGYFEALAQRKLKQDSARWYASVSSGLDLFCHATPVSASNATPDRRCRMSKSSLLGSWVKRFLLDHLIEERNLSRNTQRSYRDTLALLLPYVAAEQSKPVDRLDVFDLSSEVLCAASSII